MTDSEVLCKKINRLYTTITTLLGKDVVERIVYDKLDAFEELLDALVDPDAADAKAKYEKQLAELWSKVANILAEKSPSAPAGNMVVVPTKSDADELPRNALPSWNGKTETFFAFWSQFKARVLDVTGLSEDARMFRLCNALPEAVTATITGLSLDKAKASLLQKYQSEDAITE